MSRTDVHAPYWVKARDPQWRDVFTEDHNHTYRSWHTRTKTEWVRHYARVNHCDLDEFLRGQRDTACSMQYVGRGNIFCGCELCTGHRARRLAHRQERVQWRAVRQDLLARQDREEFDVPVIRGKAW